MSVRGPGTAEARPVDGADRCHWIRDEAGFEVLIPHCWGCVLGGPAACTCEIEGSRLERADLARLVAEQEVLRLRTKVDRGAERYEQLVNHQRRQYAEIRRLRAVVASLEQAEC
ncbi:hypothetical protein [Paracoccus sp. (in: a-proteobacteria)]|uniref:hypothetical protein n=1 Tax=Paracoccus sp. TaxID=267 RepID=UPI0028B117B0|nr:hypothetical protein [Paracoccus sp. (in: a-proteobacteria)]